MADTLLRTIQRKCGHNEVFSDTVRHIWADRKCPHTFSYTNDGHTSTDKVPNVTLSQ